ncbi:MAG: alpha/beta fold hydrolase [Sinimarinibacterium sp.]|jgi:3-oxoadipate enol-lactonase
MTMAPPTIQTVPANGITVAYTRSGQGPAVVLLHGGEADHGMFDSLVPLLAPRLDVIAPDQRDSGATANPAADYTMADLADDVAALIGALGLPAAAVVGFSFGGMVAQELAIRHPQQVGHLVLAATTPGGALAVEKLDDMIRAAAARAQAEMKMSPQEKAQARARLLFGASYLAAHPEAVAQLQAVLVERPMDAGRRRGMAALRHDTGERLGQVRAPTLVLCGSEDAAIAPENGARIAARIPGARLERIDGAGHALSLEQPQRVAALITQFVAGR